MPRDKLKVVTPSVEQPASGYVLDQQAGFLMRVAMQRHTSIFTARMIALRSTIPRLPRPRLQRLVPRWPPLPTL